MASTGNVFPTVGANVDRAGSTAWTNPGDVVSDNTTDATVVVPSDYLVTSGYGFTIPSTATILGVTVRVEASESGSGTSNYIPQLHSDTTPTLIGAAKSAVTVNGTTKAISSNGGVADLWSATLTPAIVNAAGFGVSIWSTDTVNTLAIDFVTIAIEYIEAKTANLGADSANNWADSLAALRAERLSVAAGPDSANAFADSITVAGTSSIAASLAADSLNNWADTLDARRVIAASLAADSANNLADSLAAVADTALAPGSRSSRFAFSFFDDEQRIIPGVAGITPITVDASDSAANFADTLTPISGLLAQLAADDVGVLADALSQTIGLLSQPGADSAANFADTLAGVLALLADTGPDSAESLADALSGLRKLFATFAADDAANLADAIATAIGIELRPASDSANSLTDSLAMARDLLANLTDPTNDLADSIAGFVDLSVRATDAANNLADLISIAGGSIISASLVDSLSFDDSLTGLRNIFATLSDDAANLADSRDAILAHLVNLSADSAANLADGLAGVKDHLVSLSDSAANLGDSLTISGGADLAIALADSAANLADSLGGALAHLARLSEALSFADSVAKAGDAHIDLTVEINAPSAFSAALELTQIVGISSGANWSVFPRDRQPKPIEFAQFAFVVLAESDFHVVMEIRDIALERAQEADEEWLMVA